MWVSFKASFNFNTWPWYAKFDDLDYCLFFFAPWNPQVFDKVCSVRKTFKSFWQLLLHNVVQTIMLIITLTGYLWSYLKIESSGTWKDCKINQLFLNCVGVMSFTYKVQIINYIFHWTLSSCLKISWSQ